MKKSEAKKENLTTVYPQLLSSHVVHPEQAPLFLKGALKDPRPLWSRVIHPELLPAVLHLLDRHLFDGLAGAPLFLKGASKDPQPLRLSRTLSYPQPLRLRKLLLRGLLGRTLSSAGMSGIFQRSVFIVSFTFVFAFSFAFSQQVSVNATIDSQSVVIGDWIRYSIEVKHPSSVTVTLPVLKDTMGLFDIVLQDSLQRTEENGEVLLKKDFTIAKYDAGSFYIQPFAVQYKNAQGKVEIAQSNPIPVEIRGVEVDTSQTIKDVKAPLTVPLSAEEVAAYIGIAAAIGGLAYVLYYFMKKRKRDGSDIQEQKKPNIPAHVLALMQLEALEAKRLWQAGEIKAYYSEATEIIRRYFESRYGIMALEMTTGEVMMQLEQFRMHQQTVTSIEALLTGADLVKFAKYQPVAAENEQIIAQARLIVEQTKPVTESQLSESAEVQQPVV